MTWIIEFVGDLALVEDTDTGIYHLARVIRPGERTIGFALDSSHPDRDSAIAALYAAHQEAS